MRYPRAFLVFNPADDQLDESHFQGLANAKRKVYLENVSKAISTIEDEIILIKDVDSYLGGKGARQTLVLSGPCVVGFLNYYFADKDLSIYWIDNKDEFNAIWELFYSLEHLFAMNHHLEDAALQYISAYKSFRSIAKRCPYPDDKLISDIQAYAYWDNKTVLESEIKVLIKSKLSQGILNRFDIN